MMFNRFGMFVVVNLRVHKYNPQNALIWIGEREGVGRGE